MSTFFVFLISCFSCTNNSRHIDNFLYKKISLNQISKIEANFNSDFKETTVPVYLSEEYVHNPYEISTFPLVYIRRDKDFSLIPQVKVQYFYNETDSVLRLVDYTWDALEFEGTLDEVNSDLDNYLVEFDKKYQHIYSQISNTLNEPIKSTPAFVSKKDSSHRKWLEKSAKWQNGNNIVELRFVFTQGEGKLGTHRIRVKSYWID